MTSPARDIPGAGLPLEGTETSQTPGLVQEGTPHEDPPPEGEVRIRLLTDPWSVWCWGFEPVRRALEHRYPSITFQFLLGGMFERLPDPGRAGFDMDRFFGTVHRATGMPVSTDALRGSPPSSTFPACIHLHAVRLIDRSKAGLALRKLREAAYLDGRNISQTSVGADAVEDAGVDRETFLEALESGEPEREFRHRLTKLQQQGLTAYPTLLVEGEQGQTTVHGFQSLPQVLGVAEEVSGRVHPSMPPPSLDDLLSQGERWTTREVAEGLDVKVEQAFEELEEAREDGRVEREPYPTGDAWRVA